MLAASDLTAQLADRVEFRVGDGLLEVPDGSLDLVVCNPPYRRAAADRINPNSQRAVARHEIETRLSDVAAAANRLLKTGGRSGPRATRAAPVSVAKSMTRSGDGSQP